MTYTVRINPKADGMLMGIQDRRIRRLLLRRMEGLASEPEKQGAPLRGALAGYRAVRAVGQRYRIIYRIDESGAVVVVAALGIRREGDRADVYAVAERLARLGLL